MDIISDAPAPPDPLVHNLFALHREALIIYTDLTPEGESRIAAFQKLDVHGPLASVLITLLENLISARESKHRSAQAARPTAGDENLGPAVDQAGHQGYPTAQDQSGGEANDG